MNWAPLTLAVIFGVPAIALMVRHKAHRTVAILAAFAVLCLLAGIPSFLAAVGHPLKPGLTLLIVVAVFCGSVVFVYWDIIRGEHKTAILKGKSGGQGTPGAGGGKNHHIRPLVACVGLAMASLMLVFNWAAVAQSVTGGFSQTVSTITHRPAS